jgi:hypothetical protein
MPEGRVVCAATPVGLVVGRAGSDPTGRAWVGASDRVDLGSRGCPGGSTGRAGCGRNGLRWQRSATSRYAVSAMRRMITVESGPAPVCASAPPGSWLVSGVTAVFVRL